MKTSNEAFGLFDYSMFPKLNRILKPYGVQLKKRTSRNWGDQVKITVEKLIAVKPKRKKASRNTQPMDAGCGMFGIQMGN